MFGLIIILHRKSISDNILYFIIIHIVLWREVYQELR